MTEWYKDWRIIGPIFIVIIIIVIILITNTASDESFSGPYGVREEFKIEKGEDVRILDEDDIFLTDQSKEGMTGDKVMHSYNKKPIMTVKPDGIPRSYQDGRMQLGSCVRPTNFDTTDLYLRRRKIVPPATSAGDVSSVTNKVGDDRAMVKKGTTKLAGYSDLTFHPTLSGVGLQQNKNIEPTHIPHHSQAWHFNRPFYRDPFNKHSISEFPYQFNEDSMMKKAALPMAAAGLGGSAILGLILLM